MSYRLLISPFIAQLLKWRNAHFNINKPNNMSSFLFIIKAKQKNILIDKI
jgi:hypothetical protein